MSYKITFRKRATTEYLESISWYKARSLQAAENFISIIQDTLYKIQQQPIQFRKTYKDFHEAKTKTYPFTIIYFIDEAKNRVVITSIFHQKRNPKNKFRKQS